MCLSRVDFHTKSIKSGYKVLQKESVSSLFDSTDVLYTEFQGRNKPLPMNRWLHSDDYKASPVQLTLATDNHGYGELQHYQGGFHIFVTKKAADSWADRGHLVVAKVHVNNCVASGYQRCYRKWHGLSYYRTVVAKQIKIVEVLLDMVPYHRKFIQEEVQ